MLHSNVNEKILLRLYKYRISYKVFLSLFALDQCNPQKRSSQNQKCGAEVERNIGFLAQLGNFKLLQRRYFCYYVLPFIP